MGEFGWFEETVWRVCQLVEKLATTHLSRVHVNSKQNMQIVPARGVETSRSELKMVVQLPTTS